MKTARDWVDALGLQPHPEGGYFKETYRSTESVDQAHLPPRFGGSRAFSTAIYFLLEAGQVSAWHRIKSDELWHFYDGGPLEISVRMANGQTEVHSLGLDLEAGERPQIVIPANHWFSARPKTGTAYTLVGCTVSPGFDFADFTLAPPGER